MKEHYGLEIPAWRIQRITKEHAKKIAAFEPSEIAEKEQLIVAEMDGGMLPIVEVAEKVEGIDLRKTRKVCWKEAKLCFARGHKKIRRIYGAIIGGAEEAGVRLRECAKRIGFGEKTHVHALGDGAQWIVDQVEKQFGLQAYFLIDFFHMCEYLAEASVWCDALAPKRWLEEKKEKMKTGGAEKVLHELKIKLEQIEGAPEDNGLAKCVHYMEKRIAYMDYRRAKEHGLPIGSGEIESSHRHVVQKRLKTGGAWWKTENANAMLQLRTARANGYWTAYWREKNVA
jgi:hypothetical protein